jgi:hypothetical protein
MSRQFFLLATLICVTAAQAAPGEKQTENKEQASVPDATIPAPAPRLPDPGADAGRGGRYGAGYEARQGFGAGVQGGRGGHGSRNRGR